MSTKLEINNLMIGLSAAYPDFHPKNLDATIKAYEESLQGFPADLLKKAVDRCRDTCLFFPKIAEIRKAINEITTASVPNTSAAYMEKTPLSPAMSEYLDNFRQAMVDAGKWHEYRPSKEQRAYEQDRAAAMDRGE